MASRNPLSCLRCKKRKIKCDRVEPRCDKCREAQSSCEYVPRRARTKKSLPSSKGSLDPNTLQGVQSLLGDISHRLSRLERLEEQRYGGLSLPSDGDASEISQDGSVDPPLSQQDAPASLPRLVAEASALAQCFLEYHEATTSSSERDVRILKALENIDLNNTPIKSLSPDVKLDDPDKIPKELSQRWTRVFFDSFHSICTLVPLKMEYVMLIPDLLETPHVTIDVAVQIMWHSVLFHGLHADSESIVHRGTYSAYIYRKCLNLSKQWKEKTKLTRLDLDAAILMSWLACEKLDINTAHQFHRKACRLAREFGYFRVDAPGRVRITAEDHDEELDHNKRFSFWVLQSLDTVFRLHFNKPCQIKTGSWQVKFPEFRHSGQSGKEEALEISFIVSMRLALMSRQYFDYKDGLRDHDIQTLEEFNVFIDSLIDSIDAIMQEWNIEHRFATANTPLEAWLLADLIFNSRTTEILFAREKSERNSQAAVPQNALDAARSTILAVQRMCATHPVSANYSMSFISLYPIVSVITIYSHVLRVSNPADAEPDLALTEWLGSTLQAWVKEREELKPVTNFVNTINGVCRQVMAIKAQGLKTRDEGIVSSNDAFSTQPFWELSSTDFELGYLMQDPVHYMRQLEVEILNTDTEQYW